MKMMSMVSIWRVLFLGSLAISLFSCGALPSQPASKIVRITGFDKITGNWEGPSKRVPDMRDDAWVLLIISESGHFNFASNRDRSRGLLLGTGNLYVEDGIVFGKSSAGTGMFTLHDKGGKRILVADVALTDGHHYFIEMLPVESQGDRHSIEQKFLYQRGGVHAYQAY